VSESVLGRHLAPPPSGFYRLVQGIASRADDDVMAHADCFRRRYRIGLSALLLLGAALLAPLQAAARPDAAATLTPLAMTVLNPPVPVLGADGRKHLAYEITIANQSRVDVTIDRVQARAGGAPFSAPVQGNDFAEQLRVFAHEGETTIPAGGNAMLFMDVRYGQRAANPRRLNHSWELTATDPEGKQPDQTYGFRGVGTRVSSTKPLVIEPPLRGSRWLNANGCCLPIGGHRGGTLSVDGTIHVGERYAIDFVGLESSHRLFDGPVHELSSYGYFGTPVRSATAGRVVDVVDDEPEQVPGILPTGLSLRQLGGNYVTVRIDRRHFAFYAHLSPGSVRVEKGDRVRPGQVLGLLGNTGNTDAPHLHFQIMSGRSPLQSNGLPFVFTRFAGMGVVTDLDGMPEGEPLPVDDRLTGPMRDRMPIAQQLVAFGL
jgi:hypothetical protein